MASYRGGFNASAPDGGGGFARGSYRGGASNLGAQGDDNAAGNSGFYRGEAPRGGYGQRDNSSSGGEGFRGGRGSYEGQSYRGSGEGYRGGNRGSSNNRGGGSQADGEQSGGYRGGGCGGYSNQGYQDNRDLAAPNATSSYQPTEEEKTRLAVWDATPVTKPSPFAAFKKPSVLEPQKQPEPIVQPTVLEPEPIVKPKVDEPVLEAASTVHDRINADHSVSGSSLSEKFKNQTDAGVEVAENVIQPVIAAVSVTIDKEKYKPIDALATGVILNVVSEVLAGVENFVDVTKEPIPEDPVKHSTVPTSEVAVTGSASGFVRDLTRDDLVKLVEISKTLKDAFTKLHELVVRML
uniref:Uncharacterized protein n=1 Tax=Ditylenchus dipsaci TaxID=166011 RepID=A0A915D257_9BILA